MSLITVIKPNIEHVISYGKYDIITPVTTCIYQCEYNWNKTILVSNPNKVGVLLNSDYKQADYYGNSYDLNMNKRDYT